MTRDQKTVLKALAVAMSFKAVLISGMVYSTKHYRRMISSTT